MMNEKKEQSQSTVTSLEVERVEIDTFISAADVYPIGTWSECVRAGMDEKGDTGLQQVPGKHLILLQREERSGRREGEESGTGEVRVCVCLCVWGEESERTPSVHVAEVADWLVLHDAQVVHGTAEGDLDSLADAGRASLHHFDFVYGLVHSQRNHLGSRKPLPEGEKTDV